MNPDSLRTANPQAYPQYPFDRPPEVRERSEPSYGIRAEPDQMVAVRDGVRLALDVYRPAGRPGERFPALVGFGPYTRQLQQTNVPIGHNEAGIKEFWVPRGYAMVFVDVRGTNGSEGLWDMYGSVERADLADIIEWVAARPWCSGQVGMTGQSYYSRTQLQAAIEQPPSLKAIFAYDAGTDAYRDSFFHGGIPSEGMQRRWLGSVRSLNARSGRLTDTQKAAMTDRIREVVGLDHPLDGPYWQERSPGPRLDEISIPVYFGVRWSFSLLHLRGAFSGWMGTGDIPKRMFIGPDPVPNAPHATYHGEALRWYDHWLKGMDTGVMEGAPIQLWIPGHDAWRGEYDWPLERTEWTEFHLGGAEGGLDGTLDRSPGPAGAREYHVDPAGPEWLFGGPRLRYRSEPFESDVEVTGPVQLDLRLTSSAADTDLFVTLHDEAPGGGGRLLTRGWLRASHRAVDPQRSTRNQPWHPHTQVEPLEPGEAVDLQIEIVPTSNVFRAGHRVRLEISGSDSMPDNPEMYHRGLLVPATNHVHEGAGSGSRLVLPVIPGSSV